MLWIKSFHIIFIVSWMAGLLYLPRLFVYHAETSDEIGNERFKVMERKLFYGIATPSAVLGLATGLVLWLGYGYSGTWLHYKLVAVWGLLIFHLLCLRYMIAFKNNCNTKSHVYYRWFNEIPIVILAIIVFLVVFKPQW